MIYHFGACTYDSDHHELRRDRQKITVERQVREVLLYFLQHRHRVLSRDELLESCWRETYVSDAALSSCLSRLRQAIGQRRGGPVLIQTVHGAGYRFVAEVVEVAEDALNASAAVEEVEASPHVPQTPPPAVSPMPGTERRQLTILSCALSHVDALMEQLDEETLHELLQQFRTLARASIARFDGYVAQYGTASVLVYFGYPQAHEDDAQRAIRSGLALVEQMGELAAVSDALSAAALSVQVGIHTGGVIVESLPSTPNPMPVMVVGSTPSVAVRVQEVARPQTVVISAATAHLVQGYFACKDLADEVTVEGGAALGLYEVEGIQSYEGDVRLASVPRLTPFVGREAEMALLLERWHQACEGEGQVVLVRGEAGMGKSRLVQELKVRALSTPHLRVECRSSPYHQNTAFYPLMEALRRALQWEAESDGAEPVSALEGLLGRFRSLVGELVPLLAELLGLDLPPGGMCPCR